MSMAQSLFGQNLTLPDLDQYFLGHADFYREPTTGTPFFIGHLRRLLLDVFADISTKKGILYSYLFHTVTPHAASKVPVFGVAFSRIRTEYGEIPVFSPNARKCGPE